MNLGFIQLASSHFIRAIDFRRNMNYFFLMMDRKYRCNGHCRIFLIFLFFFLVAGLPSLAASSLDKKISVTKEAAYSTLGYYLAGRFARYLGDQQSAARFYKKVLASDENNKKLKRRTLRLMLVAGQLGESIELAKSVQSADGDNNIATTVRIVEAVKYDNYKKALQALESFSSSGVGELMGPILEAWIMAGIGNSSGAHGALKRLEVAGKFSAFGQYHKALIYDFLESEETDAAYRALIKNKPTRSIRAVESYASFLRRTGSRRQAQELLSRHLPVDSKNPVSQQAWFFASKNAERRLIASAGEGISEALYAAASALAKNSERELAIIYARLAIYLRTDFALAKILLGETLEADRNWQDAIEAYEQIELQSPLSWYGRLRIAKNLNRLLQTKESLSLLSILAEEQPDRTEPLIVMGDLYRSKKRWLKAVQKYDTAVGRLDSYSIKDWVLFYYRGIALERAKKWNKAEADFLKALDLKPNQPLVMNYLGYSWVEQGENLQKAREMIEKAVQLRPRDGYIVDSLGWVLYRTGDYEGAVKNLERAVLLLPNDPVINAHLGDAYWRVGRFREARFQWKRALIFGPTAEEIPGIKRRLREGLNNI